MTPLFDKSCNHAAWMSNDGRNLFDAKMNWIAVVMASPTDSIGV